MQGRKGKGLKGEGGEGKKGWPAQCNSEARDSPLYILMPGARICDDLYAYVMDRFLQLILLLYIPDLVSISHSSSCGRAYFIKLL